MGHDYPSAAHSIAHTNLFKRLFPRQHSMKVSTRLLFVSCSTLVIISQNRTISRFSLFAISFAIKKKKKRSRDCIHRNRYFANMFPLIRCLYRQLYRVERSEAARSTSTNYTFSKQLGVSSRERNCRQSEKRRSPSVGTYVPLMESPIAHLLV